MDEVFKALADPSRRSLLDRLHVAVQMAPPQRMLDALKAMGITTPM